MEPKLMQLAQTKPLDEIIRDWPVSSRANSSHALRRAADRVKLWWRSESSTSAFWDSLVGRVRTCGKWLSRTQAQRNPLRVCETAALGDRRFVSVIQFERQRFLIGSSPSSITLLSALPDEPSRGDPAPAKTESEERE
jgi:hypothetical protein